MKGLLHGEPSYSIFFEYVGATVLSNVHVVVIEMAVL